MYKFFSRAIVFLLALAFGWTTVGAPAAEASTTHQEVHWTRTVCLNGNIENYCNGRLDIKVTAVYRASRTAEGVWDTGLYVRPYGEGCSSVDRIYGGEVLSWRAHTSNYAELQRSVIRSHGMGCGYHAYVPMDHVIHHGNRMTIVFAFWVGIGNFYKDQQYKVAMALCRKANC